MIAPSDSKTKRAAPDRATRDTTIHNAKDTASTNSAQAAKWIAMALYNCGAQSFSATQAAFGCHPEWAAA